jgi:hypothetical protein
MPVIINDFEIVVDSPETPETGGGREAAAPPASPPTIRPDEIVKAIVQVIELNYERMKRVRAD